MSLSITPREKRQDPDWKEVRAGHFRYVGSDDALPLERIATPFEQRRRERKPVRKRRRDRAELDAAKRRRDARRRGERGRA